MRMSDWRSDVWSADLAHQVDAAVGFSPLLGAENVYVIAAKHHRGVLELGPSPGVGVVHVRVVGVHVVGPFPPVGVRFGRGPQPVTPSGSHEIGSAAGRGRVGQCDWITGVTIYI